MKTPNTFWLPPLVLALSFGLVSAQNKQIDSEALRKKEQRQDIEDPFDEGYNQHNSNQKISEWRKTARLVSTQIRMEWVEVHTTEAIKALDAIEPMADASALRKKLLSHSDSSIIDAQLSHLAVGESTYTQSILEMIYPTEYIAPQLTPRKLENGKKEYGRAKTVEHPFKSYLNLLHHTGLVPTCFESRNTGLSAQLALEPVSRNPSLFDLLLEPAKVNFHGMKNHGHGPFPAKMPIFSTVSSQSIVRLAAGQWRLANMQ